MANQKINIFEQHVEKLAVGLGGLLFLWVTYAYLLSSPNKLELSGQMVSPSEIDLRVQSKAEEVFNRVRNAKPKVADIRDFAEEQRQLSQGALHQTEFELEHMLVSSVVPGPPVPDVEGPLTPGQVTLATLLPPDKPTVAVGRLTAMFPPESVPIGESLDDNKQLIMELEGATDRSWVTLAVEFDYLKQREVFLANNYQTNRFTITVADILLRRQQRLPNGEWGSWQEIEEYGQYHMDKEPALTLLTDADGRLYVPARQRSNLKTWLGNLQEFQSDLVRPPMPDPEAGEAWHPPFLVDLIEMYPEEIYPEPEMVKQDTKKNVPPLKQAKADLKLARQLKDDGKLGVALGVADKILAMKGIPRGHKVKEQARVLVEEILAEQRKREIESMRDGGAVAGGELEEEKVRTKDIFFAHDTEAEPGSTYRYQLKIQAFNYYVAIADRLKNPLEDATKIYIESEWSPPTDPVKVPSQQRVFLASAKAEAAQFEIYKWFQGSWLREKFSTKIGERIGGSRRIVVDGQRTHVEFETGLLLLDLLQDRPFIPRKRQRDGSVELGEPETSAAAICQRQDGKVLELVQAQGKIDAERKVIEEEMKDAKRRSRRPRRHRQAPPSGRSGGRGGGRGGGG